MRKGKYIRTREFRKRMSDIRKGMTAWNKGKTGIYSKNSLEKMAKARRGKPLSEETKRKISKIHKGKKQSKETIRKRVESRKWWRPTEENLQNMRVAHIGKVVSEETREKMRGENGPNWQGGISFEPYGLSFNNIFREKIRERDIYCCVVCNRRQEEFKGVLHIHHVDYVKINSFPQNCVSLCRNCHAKTNFNRLSWKIFFQSLLKERYGYEYTLDQKMILDFEV